MRTVGLGLLVCGVFGMLYASEAGKITGRVTDKATGEPLPQANVVTESGEFGAATDLNGYYVILNVPAGRYKLEASMIGYRTVQMTDVRVEVDRPTRIDFRLDEAAIEMPKVVVRAEKPMVSKEMVASRYAVQAEQIAYLPADRLAEVMVFSPGVARTESSYHVRGGRATEVDYMIDGVSVVDPVSGEFGIELAKGVADEVVFMPGGFGAEYGRSMSGVINLITVNPRQKLSANYRLKSEEPMPFYYDFGYTDNGVQLHLPLAANLRTVFNAGATVAEDWDPRLFVQEHKDRQDYSLYGKLFYNLGGRLKVDLSGAASRTQFDRYDGDWRLILDNYRSDMRHGDLGVGKLTFMPNSRSFYSVGVSRFHTDKTYGVRRPGRVRFWEDYEFRDTSEYRLPVVDENNPYRFYSDRFQEDWYFFSDGTYQEYRKTSTDDWGVRILAENQVTANHQVSLGSRMDFYDVATDWVRWPSTTKPAVDAYRNEPATVGVYLQDKIDYEGLYASAGIRYDMFDPNATYKINITDPKPDAERAEASVKQQVSPRLGISFRITEWLFARANYGYYFQMPLFSVLYDNSHNPYYYRNTYEGRFDDTLLVVGNPDLDPERTQAYELGVQGEVAEGLALSVNVWRKDVAGLVGTRVVPALPRRYVTYFNVDHARLTGVEGVVDFRNTWFNVKFSYSYSDAVGTSSYANEAYEEFIQQGDTAPAVEYPLDFNQPHRFFAQVDMHSPEDPTPWKWANTILDGGGLHLLGYAGTGFPYTPEAEEGGREQVDLNSEQAPWRTSVDGVLTKRIGIGGFNFDIVVEVLNILDSREILFVYPRTRLPNDDGNYPPFTAFEYITSDTTTVVTKRIGDYFYDCQRDYNHDGYVTGSEAQLSEHWRAVQYHHDWIDWVSNYGPPRRARLGIEIGW